jgi:hypothetical protein
MLTFCKGSPVSESMTRPRIVLYCAIQTGMQPITDKQIAKILMIDGFGKYLPIQILLKPMFMARPTAKVGTTDFVNIR